MTFSHLLRAARHPHDHLSPLEAAQLRAASLKRLEQQRVQLLDLGGAGSRLDR